MARFLCKIGIENRRSSIPPSSMQVRKAHRRTPSPSLELLESRIVLATHIWMGPATGGNWSTPANWSGNSVPTTGENGGTIVQFNGGITSTDDIASLTVDEIHFLADGDTINGAANVSLGLSGSAVSNNLVNDAGNNKISSSLPLNLGGSAIFAVVTAGKLTLDDAIGNLPNSTNGLALHLGAGTLTLSGAAANTFTGNLSVLQGTVELAKTGAVACGGAVVVGLGTGSANSALLREINSDQIPDASSVTLGADGEFVLYGTNNTVVNDTISNLLLQTGTNSGANVTSVGLGGTGTLSIAGNLTVSKTGSGASGASISGVLDFGSHAPSITVDSGSVTADLAVHAKITGSAGYYKYGAGIMELFNTGPNGSTQVYGGTLLLNSPGVNDAVNGDIYVGNGSGAASSSVVRLLQSAEISTSATIHVGIDGLLDINGNSQTIDTLNLSSGTTQASSVMSGAGLLIVEKIQLFQSGTGATPGVISGHIQMAGTPSIQVFDGSASADLFVVGSIAGTDGYTKTGAGTLELVGSGPTGKVSVQAGGLLLDSAGTNDAVKGDLEIGMDASNSTAFVRLLAPSQIADTSNVTLDTNGTLDTNNFTETIGGLTLESGSAAGAVVSATGALTVAGNISLALSNGGGHSATISGIINLGTGNILVQDGAASSDLLITAQITGTHGLTKMGAGTLEIADTADDTYTGITAINEGVVLLSSHIATKSTSDTVIVGDGIGVPGSAELTLSIFSVVPDTASITVLGDGLLDAASHPDIVASIDVHAQGHISIGNTNFTSNGPLSLASGSVFTATYLTNLRSGGPVTLGGKLDFEPNSVPAIGTAYTIVTNTGALAVSGTFDGLQEGAVFGTHYGLFKISYVGGTGNDVTVTAVDSSQSVTVLPGGKSATYTDVDGDIVTVKVTKGTLTAADFSFGGFGSGVPTGLQLQELDLSDPGFAGAKVTISAKPGLSGGNGKANVGLIQSSNDLASVTVSGDLGAINAGDADLKVPGIGTLTVDGMGEFGLLTQRAGGALDSTVKNIGSLVVKGDIHGPDLVLGAAGKISVGGSVTGDGTQGSGILSLDSAGSISIAGDLRANGDGSAEITATGIIKSIKIGGSLDAGSYLSSGAIFSNGDLKSITIGHDMLGGAEIVSRSAIGALSIKGQVLGGTGASAALISAFGEATAPLKGQDVAIKSIAIGKSATNLQVHGGFDVGGAANADAVIGKISIGGDLRASDIIAGVTPGGDAIYGTADDAKPMVTRDSVNRFSTIASLIVKGQALGSVTDTSDAYGIVAEQITAASIGGIKLKLTSGPHSTQDVFALGFASAGSGGAPSDLYLREATM